MVTDSAAVISKVEYTSVSSNIHTPDETWLGCMVHYLNNIMKHCIASCNRDSILQNVASYFRSTKKVAKEANRNRWNQYVPDAFTSTQEVEMRFKTHYFVAERFLKESSKVLRVLRTKNRPIAITAFEVIKKTADFDGDITGFPAIEVICDAFSIIMEYEGRFEVASRPTVRVDFPLLFKSIRDLESVAGGATEWRKISLYIVQPSIYSNLRCRNLGQHL